jgi:hypothetical protein
MALAKVSAFVWAGKRLLTGTDIIEDLAQLAGALALLASYKIGRGGGWTRARQWLARGVTGRPCHPRAASGRGSRPSPGPIENTKRYRDRLRMAVVALWIALLLSLVGYIEFRGEAGLADLDAVGFAIVTE